MTSPGDRLRELVQADRSQFRPSSDAAAQGWSALAHSVRAGMPAPVDVPPPVASASATGASLGAGKLVLLSTLVVGAGAIATASVLTSADDEVDRDTSVTVIPHAPAALETEAEAGATPSTPVVVPDPAPSPEPSLPPAPATRPDPNPTPSARRTRRPANVDLSGALTRIKQAQAALAEGKPAAALELVRRCRGALTEDCLALRAIAMCSLGKARAPSNAESFLRKYPSSIYADRVRSNCR
ncbi:MAG: hypothetical protein AAGF11_44185 [Myxococcota bacterium]